jgi:hypothetical protein
LGSREIEAAVLERSLDALAALFDGHVGQAHHVEIAQAS